MISAQRSYPLEPDDDGGGDDDVNSFWVFTVYQTLPQRLDIHCFIKFSQ